MRIISCRGWGLLLVSLGHYSHVASLIFSSESTERLHFCFRMNVSAKLSSETKENDTECLYKNSALT